MSIGHFFRCIVSKRSIGLQSTNFVLPLMQIRTERFYGRLEFRGISCTAVQKARIYTGRTCRTATRNRQGRKQMGARHRFARHKHIRASGQRPANDLGRTNSRRNKAGAQYCFSCTSICRFVFSTISICLANNTFNLFYPFCSSLHSCTRTLPRQCCHSMEGQFFCCPHSLRRKIRGVSRFGTIGSGHIVFLEIL